MNEDSLDNSSQRPDVPTVSSKLNESFEFTGDGKEYFKIWIVNIILTVITFGIYGPWAKVRNKNYFYGKTQLAGQGFRYHATPMMIFKGRVIAFLFFVAYSMVSEFLPFVGMGLAFGLLFVFPWIMNRTLQFNAVNSSYRGVRFHFNGSYLGALKVLYLWPLLNILCLGLLTPITMKKTHQYIVSNSSFGTSVFEFSAKNSHYYSVFMQASCILVIGACLAVLLIALELPAVAGIIGYITFFIFSGYLKLGLRQVYLNAVSSERKRLRVKYVLKDYMSILLVNALLVLVTLGLFYPFAKVRITRFFTNPMKLRGRGDLESFTAAERENTKALGEEMGEIFDLDVGFA